ncbi:MAG: hypothetical protein RIC14_00620 [Filomicrobium sp.]
MGDLRSDGMIPKTNADGYEVDQLRKRISKYFGIDTFTCDECDARYTCPYAFDPYNTNGDCLAEK